MFLFGYTNEVGFTHSTAPNFSFQPLHFVVGINADNQPPMTTISEGKSLPVSVKSRLPTKT